MNLAVALLLALQPFDSGSFGLQKDKQDKPRHFDPLVHEATKEFSYDDFLIVPVRVHVLQSRKHEALQSRLKERDVKRIFWKVNRIWNKAGLGMMVESLVFEEASAPDDFAGAIASFPAFRATRPKKSRAAGMVHVYYVHELRTNGVFMGRDAIYVKDMASLRPVRGGVDEPIPRVTSHEIGHAMGLAHRQDRTNVMASGTTGWSLNDKEIDKVRDWAKKTKWTLTPEQTFGLRRYAFLADLPGESPVKDRAKKALSRTKTSPDPK